MFRRLLSIRRSCQATRERLQRGNDENDPSVVYARFNPGGCLRRPRAPAESNFGPVSIGAGGKSQNNSPFVSPITLLRIEASAPYSRKHAESFASEPLLRHALPPCGKRVHSFFTTGPISGGKVKSEDHELLGVAEQPARTARRQGGPLADLRPEAAVAGRRPARHRAASPAAQGLPRTPLAPGCTGAGVPTSGGGNRLGRSGRLNPCGGPFRKFKYE